MARKNENTQTEAKKIMDETQVPGLKDVKGGPKQDLTTAVYIQASIREIFAAIRYEIKQHHADSLSKGTVLRAIDKVENEQTADPKQEENDTEQPEGDTEREPENKET